ncbi:MULTISPECIES: hypothetical protein [unclassified Pseudoxanthomonas]|uniref:hypothetical protein n=1 Tax=unclassified Pseudoxanthomonas TaxID=2645906 RepID=UPI00307E46AD
MSRPRFFRRRIGEQHFAIAFWLAFVTFMVGGALLLLVFVAAQMYSSIDCEWRPQSARCTLLDERGGW